MNYGSIPTQMGLWQALWFKSLPLGKYIIVWLSKKKAIVIANETHAFDMRHISLVIWYSLYVKTWRDDILCHDLDFNLKWTEDAMESSMGLRSWNIFLWIIN